MFSRNTMNLLGLVAAVLVAGSTAQAEITGRASIGLNSYNGGADTATSAGAEVLCETPGWTNSNLAGGAQNVWAGSTDDHGNGSVTWRYGRPQGGLQTWAGASNSPLPLLKGLWKEHYYGQNVYADNLDSLGWNKYDVYLYNPGQTTAILDPGGLNLVGTSTGLGETLPNYVEGVNYVKWTNITLNNLYISFNETNFGAIQLVQSELLAITIAGTPEARADWGTGTTWDLGGPIPGATHDAKVRHSVTLAAASGPQSISSLALDNVNSDLLIASGASLTAGGATVKDGALRVDGALNAGLTVSGGSATLAAGSTGTIGTLKVTSGSATLDAGSAGTIGTLNASGGTTSLGRGVGALAVSATGIVNTTAAVSVPTVTVSGGSLNAGSGHLTAETLTVTGGIANVTDATVSQKLAIGTDQKVTVSPGNTFKVTGTDLANSAVARTLTLQGGTVGVTGSPILPGGLAAGTTTMAITTATSLPTTNVVEKNWVANEFAFRGGTNLIHNYSATDYVYGGQEFRHVADALVLDKVTLMVNNITPAGNVFPMGGAVASENLAGKSFTLKLFQGQQPGTGPVLTATGTMPASMAAGNQFITFDLAQDVTLAANTSYGFTVGFTDQAATNLAYFYCNSDGSLYNPGGSSQHIRCVNGTWANNDDSDVFGIHEVPTSALPQLIAMSNTNVDVATSTTLDLTGAASATLGNLTMQGGSTLTLAGPGLPSLSFNNITATGTSSIAAGVPISLRNGDVTVAATKTLTVNPAIVDGTAATTLNKLGDGTLTLLGANTYTGATNVNAGTLLVNGTHTGGDNYTVSGTGTLGGIGTITPASGKTVTVQSGGTIAPGASPGTLTVASMMWANGGSYLWETNAVPASGTPGVNWDVLMITGELNFSTDPSAEFTMKVSSLGGAVAGWDGAGTFTWTVAQATGGISGFNAGNFTINTDGWNPLNPLTGVFEIAQDSNYLKLKYVQEGASYTWKSGAAGPEWEVGSRWQSEAVPGKTKTAIFNNLPGNPDNMPTLSEEGRQVFGLDFQQGGWTLKADGGFGTRTLTVYAGGIKSTGDAGSENTIQPNIVFAGDATITVTGATHKLTTASLEAAGLTLKKEGEGTLVAGVVTAAQVDHNEGILKVSSVTAATFNVNASATIANLTGTGTDASVNVAAAGTLKLTGSGSIANSPTITVSSGAILDTSDFITWALAPGQTIKGNGTVNGPMTVASGSVLSPGESAGKLTVTSMTWAGQGSYLWETGNTAGTPGVDWDLVDVVNGALDITASETDKFVIKVVSLGALPGWGDGSGDFIWWIAETGVINGFDAGNFTINTSGWNTGLNPLTGEFQIGLDGNNLMLSYGVTDVDDSPPIITSVRLNGVNGRSVSAIEPSGIGVRTIEVTFSEPVNFGGGAVTIQTFPAGATLIPASTSGTGTNKMTITFDLASIVDTWLKVRLNSGAVTDLAGNALDGESKSTGSGRGYIYEAAIDLPTGDGVTGGDAVFYVGSLRGDFRGVGFIGNPPPDGQLTPEDFDGFLAAYQAGNLDADLRGMGFIGNPPPDGLLTPEDFDGFLAAYQVGSRLDPLPASLGPQSLGAGTPLALASPAGLALTVERPQEDSSGATSWVPSKKQPLLQEGLDSSQALGLLQGAGETATVPPLPSKKKHPASIPLAVRPAPKQVRAGRVSLAKAAPVHRVVVNAAKADSARNLAPALGEGLVDVLVLCPEAALKVT